MAIRLRELRSSHASEDLDLERPQPDSAPLGDSASGNASVRRSRRGRGTLRFCLALGLYIVVVLLLLTTWSNWRESRPRAVLDLGWQNLHEAHFAPSATASEAAQPPSPTTQSNQGVQSSQHENLESSATSTQPAAPAAPAFPPDRYLPLLPNKAPLVDLAVQVCYFGLPCEPPPQKEDAHGLFGPWVRVNRHVDSILAESEGRVNVRTANDPAAYTAPGGSSVFGTLGSLFPISVTGHAGGGALNQLTSLFEQKWIFYRRSKVGPELSPQRIVDIRLVQQGDDADSLKRERGWRRIKRDLRSRWMTRIKTTLSGKPQGPAYLFYRLDTSGADNDTRLPSVTELDVIYGDNDPLPGFEFISTPIIPHDPTSHTVGSRVCVRHDPVIPPEVPMPITFRSDGTFKVLQLADLHYSLARQPCRDADPARSWRDGTCIGEDETEMRVGQWLDQEKPDLVVLSGDQLNGQGSTWDERSTIMRVLRPMVKRKILWTSIGGNHDSQSGFLTRAELQSLYRQMPYSKTFAGPPALDDGTEIFGSANFHLFLHSPHADHTHLASLYFMDSGAHVPEQKDTQSGWFPSWMGSGNKLSDGPYSSHYGYIHRSQIDWFDQLSTSVKTSVRPYHPDTGHDLPPLWPAEGGVNAKRAKQIDHSTRMERRPLSKRRETLHKPPAIMFQHIPVPEAFNATVDTNAEGKKLVFGERKETAGLQGAQARAGFFDLLRLQSSAGTRDVQVLAHGHMHLNADCRRIEGVWICFAGGASLAGYGDPGFSRRARVFFLDKWGERISSYHVYEDGSRDEANVLFEI